MERRWKVLIVNSVAVFMALLHVTIVNIAFADVRVSFRGYSLADTAVAELPRARFAQGARSPHASAALISIALGRIRARDVATVETAVPRDAELAQDPNEFVKDLTDVNID